MPWRRESWPLRLRLRVLIRACAPRPVGACSPPLRRFLLTYSFLLQTYLVLYAVPVVGTLLHFAHLSWYWAFFCYEYAWALHGWTIDARVAAVETEWAFLAGFGAPLALLSVLFPAFVSYGIVAFLFPLFVILATVSVPEKHEPHRWAPARLPLFHAAKRLSLLIVRSLGRRMGSPHQGGRGRPKQAPPGREAGAGGAPSGASASLRQRATASGGPGTPQAGEGEAGDGRPRSGGASGAGDATLEGTARGR